MARRHQLTVLAAAALTTTFALAACGGGQTTPASGAQSDDTSGAQSQAQSSAPTLETVTPGKLTIATGDPAYSPWVEDNKPESGKGFEAAIAYAVAEELGFAKEDVVWTRTTFDAAIAPGAKDWDFNLQQYSITDERKKAVDFSSPYYTTAQVVLTTEDSPAAKATSLADLKDVLFGVQVGTTSQKVLKELVAPTKEPQVINNSVDVVAKLKAKQVDAIVVDLPTAFYLAGAELDNAKLVGQFADTSGGDELGLVLPKGSALTPAVTQAVDSLREKGTLDELAKKWLSDAASVPVLK
ncbi:amino acid ABC transporter substrate-binding protein [Schaalia sp. 19OD2882]|uniref:ABC transporter substrate-binding protein n=1 Tax=Schaalia sp. 19OD2882 TaxID=2794089 RepID=UPI001C1EC6B7|nr:ABC transporter substrate-binding protein [Schaalia sp. 19OD2882]QWW19602.1 amino acid ABC transporter substrate-binding protein [Schaalia sp. 19OD2882]